MTDEDYMHLAIKEAYKVYKKGEVPIGAVIVKDDKVISCGHNSRETKRDCTLHAEIVVLKKACKIVKNWRLTGCTLYVTKEPCIMCYGAMLNGRIERVVYGFGDDKDSQIIREKINEGGSILNHKLIITPNVLEQDCKHIFDLVFKR